MRSHGRHERRSSLKGVPVACLEKEFLKYIPCLGQYPQFYTPS